MDCEKKAPFYFSVRKGQAERCIYFFLTRAMFHAPCYLDLDLSTPHVAEVCLSICGLMVYFVRRKSLIGALVATFSPLLHTKRKLIKGFIRKNIRKPTSRAPKAERQIILILAENISYYRLLTAGRVGPNKCQTTTRKKKRPQLNPKPMGLSS